MRNDNEKNGTEFRGIKHLKKKNIKKTMEVNCRVKYGTRID